MSHTRPQTLAQTLSNTDLANLLPALRKRARRLSRSQTDAEDLVQEALVRVLQKLRDGQEIETLAPYAMRTLHNQARMKWRAGEQPEELEEDSASVEPCAMARLECAEVLQAIEALPPEQAELMHLICTGETSPAVLAKQLHLPQGTVMSRLSRARARLRTLFGERSA